MRSDERHVSNDDLSAYIDNEAEDPAAIRAHLAACPECARRWRELQEVSEAVRRLPAPDVAPQFAARVAAQVGPSSRLAGPRRTWRPGWVIGPVVAAAACLVLAVSILFALRSGEPPVNVARQDGSSEATEANPLISEITSGEDLDAWDYGFPASSEGPDVSEDEVMLALASGDWIDETVEAWDAETDLDDLISSMDEAEKQAFEQLLRAYFQESAI